MAIHFPLEEKRVWFGQTLGPQVAKNVKKVVARFQN